MTFQQFPHTNAWGGEGDGGGGGGGGGGEGDKLGLAVKCIRSTFDHHLYKLGKT